MTNILHLFLFLLEVFSAAEKVAEAKAATDKAKAEKEALRTAQRKRNAQLALKTHAVLGAQWLRDSQRPLPDAYFPGLFTLCISMIYFLSEFETHNHSWTAVSLAPCPSCLIFLAAARESPLLCIPLAPWVQETEAIARVFTGTSRIFSTWICPTS